MHHSLKKCPKISHKTRGALLQELAQTTSKSGSGCVAPVTNMRYANDYSDYNDYRDSDLELDLERVKFNELLTCDIEGL